MRRLDDLVSARKTANKGGGGVCKVLSYQRSMCHASVLLVMMNFFITGYFDNVITKFIVNNRTDALKTDVDVIKNKIQTAVINILNLFITAVCVLFLIKLRWPKNKSIDVNLFFTITNCQIARFHSLTHRINFCLSAY